LKVGLSFSFRKSRVERLTESSKKRVLDSKLTSESLTVLVSIYVAVAAAVDLLRSPTADLFRDFHLNYSSSEEYSPAKIF
jgi:hypothetical protein